MQLYMEYILEVADVGCTDRRLVAKLHASQTPRCIRITPFLLSTKDDGQNSVFRVSSFLNNLFPWLVTSVSLSKGPLVVFRIVFVCCRIVGL
jgi:hypothetical protein